MDNVQLLYNVSDVTDCQLPNSSNGGALFFYAEPTSISTTHEPNIISSRKVVVGPLDPQTTTLSSTSTTMPRRRDRARDKEDEALANIGRDPMLSQILELVYTIKLIMM